MKTYVAFLSFLSRGFIDPLNFKNHEVVLVPPNIRYGMFQNLPFKMHLKYDFKFFKLLNSSMKIHNWKLNLDEIT